MNEQEFRFLLSNMESETLDFKAKAYELTYEPDKAKFIKDILCMANTPREVTSYIILGVIKNADGSFELRGLDKHIDEEAFQSQFTNRVYPLPVFTYTEFLYQQKSYGIISIPPIRTGPCIPLNDFPSSRDGRSHNILRQQQVYFRRGSKNDLANPEDVLRIMQWMKGSDKSNNESNQIVSGDEAWERFLRATHHFEASRRYFLFAAPIIDEQSGVERISAIGKLPWSMVMDFDPKSESDGLLKATKTTLEERRNLHYVVIRERPIINPERSTCWFFARGLDGRSETISIGPWREWKTRYGSEIQEQLKKLTAAINPTPITCIAIWYDTSLTSHLRSALEAALDTMQELVDFVIITKHPADLQSIVAEFNATLIDIPFHQICSGLESFTSNIEKTEEESCQLPSSSGAPLLLDAKTRQQLEEELELVDLSAGLIPPFPDYTRRDFLRGAEAEISWYGLNNQYDISRDKIDRLKRDLDEPLRRRRTINVNLFHDAGAGGTTLARRILWDYHRTYPCAILHRYSAETAGRLYTLASLTGQPILLLIDGSQIADRQVEDLQSQLRSRQVPVVLFQVLRRFKELGKTEEQSERNYLTTTLPPVEAQRFVDALSHVDPKKRKDLEMLKQSGDARKCSAFYFCLETFGRDFRGIERYVSTRIAGLTPVQKQILVFLSIAHHYAQRPIRGQAFAEILGLPKNRVVNLFKALPPLTLELIIESRQGIWRTAHDFLALEILQQLVWPGSDRETNWTQNLSNWSKEFAQFCRGSSAIPSDEMLDLASRTFIYRDNTDLLGSERSASQRFSHLVEDIPLPQGRIELLRTVAELYPNQAHFWAHLGRFYAVVMSDFQNALENVEKALELQWNDNVLHHMKGMALRYQAYQLLNYRAPLQEVVNQVKLASMSFEEARKIDPDDSHGYISEVEMLARVLDQIGRQYGGGDPYQYLQSANADTFLKECLGRAEELLEKVRRMREGEEPSTFEENCRGRLDNLYGKYDKALQLWDNLLHRPNADRPPLRRQIVWTYLARHEREWDRLEPREIDRIISLLEENLLEEPNSDKNLSLWVQAVRRSRNPPTIEAVIERVGYWRANSQSLDSLYYLYAFFMLQVLDGSILARSEAKRYIDECSRMARTRQNRTKSLEWWGVGKGINRLVYHSELGEWITDKSTGKDFWAKTNRLARVRGRISRYDARQAGQIEVEGTGLFAFFVPARGMAVRGTTADGEIVYSGFNKDDVNRRVDFYLGFSYDGLRAWEVREIE